MNYEELEKDLTDFITKYKDIVMDCIEDFVGDIIITVKKYDT